MGTNYWACMIFISFDCYKKNIIKYEKIKLIIDNYVYSRIEAKSKI